MPEQDITEIDLYRIFKKAIFDVTVELGRTPTSPHPVSSPLPPPPPATNTLDALNTIMQETATTNNLLKMLASSLLPKTFAPRGFKQNTSYTPNTPTPLLPTSITASHFIVQNQGSKTISLGSQDVQVISIASGAMFLYSFTQANYLVDLHDIYVSSAASNQQYGVLIFI